MKNLSISDYPERFRKKPFFELTVVLLNSVRDHDFEHLASMCDDDYGIIDINMDGGSEIIRDRATWENWFQRLFSQLDSMNAQTWSEITGYESYMRSDLGYSVVDFDQMLVVGDKTMRFSVIATIVWKKEADGWKESRYHSSLVKVAD